MTSSEVTEGFQKALVDLEVTWERSQDNGNCSSTAIEGHLCNVCATFTWDPSLPRWCAPRDAIAIGGPTVPALLVSKAFRHYESLRSLMISAKHCPLCAMMQVEILQCYVWRGRRGQRVHVLAEDFVRNRGQFSIENLHLSNKSLESKILFWTEREVASYPSQHSRIYIICTEWLEQDLHESIQPRHTFTSHRKLGSVYDKSYYPFLEVHTPRGRACCPCRLISADMLKEILFRPWACLPKTHISQARLRHLNFCW